MDTAIFKIALDGAAHFRVSGDAVAASSREASRLLDASGGRAQRLLGAVSAAFDRPWAPGEFTVTLAGDDAQLAAALVRRGVSNGKLSEGLVRDATLADVLRQLPRGDSRPWADTVGHDIIVWPEAAQPLLAYLESGATASGLASERRIGLQAAFHALVHERAHTLNPSSGGPFDVVEGFTETLTQWPGTMRRAAAHAGIPFEAGRDVAGYPEGVRTVRLALGRLGIDPYNPSARESAEKLFAGGALDDLPRRLGIEH